MAYCENCGNVISEQASACPRCGHPARATVVETVVPYADLGKRVIAALIDGLVLLTAGWLIREDAGFVMWFLYDWLLIAFNDGRTVGKMAMNIRVARPDGSRVDLGMAAARAGMSLVSAFALGLGYLWAIWDPERRTWHDMVANTRVFDTSRLVR